MRYFIIDVFTSENFRGNQAGVCILEEKIEDSLMQKIAEENNLSETAFIIREDDGYNLRWFTPTFEIDLCGHGTLGAAYVVYNFIEQTEVIKFSTRSGILKVRKNEELFELEMAARENLEINLTREEIKLLKCKHLKAYESVDLILVLENEESVLEYEANYEDLKKISRGLGIVITSKGEDCDFVSRYFCPEISMEDSVTGSSHCSLIPYWSKILKKNKLVAKQVSKRGGIINCEMIDEKRVKVGGAAVMFMKGEIIKIAKF